MTDHPYRRQPDRAFWSRAVSTRFNAADVASATEPLLRADDRIVSAGSCFASHMIPWLEAAGFNYVRAERSHPRFLHLPENLGYASFSAAYGNIYTARHLRQLLERAYGRFAPVEDRWYAGSHVIDPFRPGLRYPARSDREFDLLTAQHLEAVRAAISGATVFVFTLGLTEAWELVADGAVFPACPGTIAGTFSPEKHRFHNFGVEEVREDLQSFITLLRTHNPGVRLILTISPVPLVATATGEHVLVATTYSKSVLRVAAADVAACEPSVTYFPAFEIVTGPQAPETYFAEDRRHVTEEGVNAVMQAMLAKSDVIPGHERIGDLSSPRNSRTLLEAVSAAGELSRLVAEAECDEILSDVST